MSITLRPLLIEDVDQLVKLASNRKIANTMCTLPFPFTQNEALSLVERSASSEEIVYGIESNDSSGLVGVILIRDIESCHEQAELSIWIGEPFWGKGFATAAILKLVEVGFRERGLNRIYAYCMVRNSASQRILEKSGFHREGLLRQRIKKNGLYEDVYIYSRVKRLE